MKLLSGKEFATKLAEALASANSTKTLVQELIVDALHTAASEATVYDTTKLIDLVRKLRTGTGSGTGLDTTSIVKYIMLAAPKLEKGKTKDKAIKFSWPKGGDAALRVLDQEFIASTKWWQKSKLEQDKQIAALDVNKRVANLYKAIDGADQLGTIDPNTITLVEQLLNKLRDNVAA